MTVGSVSDSGFVDEFDVESIQDKFSFSTREQKLEASLQNMPSPQDSIKRLKSKTVRIIHPNNPKLIDALAKYSRNELHVNALSYAIYMRDYDAALTLLKGGYDPNKCDQIILRNHYTQARAEIKNYLSPLSFLFIDKIEGRKDGINFVVPIRTVTRLGIKRGKICFRRLDEIDPAEQVQVRKLLGKLLERNQSMNINLIHHEVRETQGTLLIKINIYKELIKMHWNEILKNEIAASNNILLNEAIFYDNHEFIEYTICKRQGDRYLESSLNFVLTHIGIGNPGSPVSWKHEKMRQTLYIIKLLDYGANPNVRGNDGKRPIDVLLNKQDSDRKRELLGLFIEYGAKP